MTCECCETGREEKQWAVFRCVHRTYYEEGSDSWETIIDFDTDKRALRNRVNEYLASDKFKNSWRSPPTLSISRDTDKSGEVYSDGGGCGHSEWFELREFKRVSA